ncbi:hypothetical protein EYC84_000942 [Monilinia fructicola]|uniref:Uncharacterized protein n=1 Tax=Monilinia fructicola TaxID=38448 RepID=A0A5M9JJ23_MONFR|nr:hypothetical protein EYC84_000942 [Monilinia fructicola]
MTLPLYAVSHIHPKSIISRHWIPNPSPHLTPPCSPTSSHLSHNTRLIKNAAHSLNPQSLYHGLKFLMRFTSLFIILHVF